MIITLKESLDEFGGEVEFESFKLSKYNKLRAKTLLLIDLLDEYFEVEKYGDNHTLKLKK